MVASSSLRWRAPRSVADGGEHMHWWIYLAYSTADDVASTLAAMAKVGSVVGSLRAVGGLAARAWVPRRGTIHQPVLLHLCPQLYTVRTKMEL